MENVNNTADPTLKYDTIEGVHSSITINKDGVTIKREDGEVLVPYDRISFIMYKKPGAVNGFIAVADVVGNGRDVITASEAKQNKNCIVMSKATWENSEKAFNWLNEHLKKTAKYYDDAIASDEWNAPDYADEQREKQKNETHSNIDCQHHIEKEPTDNVARCAKCGSVSLSAQKKGFGVGKAVIGVATVGLIGLAAGNIGAKKVRVTCLNCGHQFWAGKK